MIQSLGGESVAGGVLLVLALAGVQAPVIITVTLGRISKGNRQTVAKSLCIVVS